MTETTTSPRTLGEIYLDEVRMRFRYYRYLTDKSLSTLDDEAFFYVPGSDSNSIAILVKHLAGNMRSRFTNFDTEDGEKPDRNRDSEFIRYTQDTRASLTESLSTSWDLVIETADSLRAAHLSETVYIRGQAHSVMEALNRQLTHYAYHVGQIVFLAKLAAGDSWESLSIAKGASVQFNQDMFQKEETN